MSQHFKIALAAFYSAFILLAILDKSRNVKNFGFQPILAFSFYKSCNLSAPNPLFAKFCVSAGFCIITVKYRALVKYCFLVKLSIRKISCYKIATKKFYTFKNTLVFET